MASTRPGPFQDFYQAALAKGIKPTMARLTLARQIAALTLTLGKKGESFDAEQLKIASRLSVSGEEPLPSPVIVSGGGPSVLETLWFEGEYAKRLETKPCLWHPVSVSSLMPPRITRKSPRPRASDRSMVDTVPPHGLISF
jgi:hypothetical protein